VRYLVLLKIMSLEKWVKNDKVANSKLLQFLTGESD
jgi:hypothetical protein